MKNLHYYLSLSTGLILFTITPAHPAFGGGTDETTEKTTHQKAQIPTKKAAVDQQEKGSQHHRTHHCPFCNRNEPRDSKSIEEAIDNSFFSYMEQAMAQSVKAMEDLNNCFQKTRDTLAIEEKNTEKCSKYSVKEFTPTDKDQYGIKITLPGFKQDDVRVTVKSTKKEFLATKNTVSITAKKSTPVEPEEVSDKKNDPKTSVKRFSSKLFTSTSYINGNRKEVTYRDGELNVSFDLPSDIDPDNYTMNFEKETLTLTFAKQQTEKTLKFDNKEN